MKRIFRNNRIIVLAFFTVFSMVAAPAVKATDSSNVVPVQLKYVGKINNQPMFQLNFSGNAQDNEFTIIIKDEGGNTLYRENIKGENFYKKFLVKDDELDGNSLRFEVISRKTKKSVAFEVNNTTRYIQEMVVNTVK